MQHWWEETILVFSLVILSTFAFQAPSWRVDLRMTCWPRSVFLQTRARGAETLLTSAWPTGFLLGDSREQLRLRANHHREQTCEAQQCYSQEPLLRLRRRQRLGFVRWRPLSHWTHATENQARFRRSSQHRWTSRRLWHKLWRGFAFGNLTQIWIGRSRCDVRPNRDDASTYRQCSVRQRTDTVCEDQPRRVSLSWKWKQGFPKKRHWRLQSTNRRFRHPKSCGFQIGHFSRVQSTPYATRSRTNANTSLPRELKESLLTDKTASPQDQAEKPQNHPGANETRPMRVADQIKQFNMMTLDSPKVKAVRSPLKFQRTPVRQSVRRLNSLIGGRKYSRMGWCAASR